MYRVCRVSRVCVRVCANTQTAEIKSIILPCVSPTVLYNDKKKS